MFNLYPKKLTFQTIQIRYISDLLKNCDINKAAGIDYLSGRFLKDGADILYWQIKYWEAFFLVYWPECFSSICKKLLTS